MRSVFFAGDVGRATTFARLLDSEGYAPEVRIVEVVESTNVSIDDDLPIAFFDLALGIPTLTELAPRLRDATHGRPVPLLLALLGEPEAGHVDTLLAAGFHMFFPADEKLSYQVRFVRRAAEGRIAFAKAMRERAELERGLRRALAIAPDPMLVHRAGKTLWFNPKWTEHYGWELEQCVGKPLIEYARGESQELIRERIRARYAGKPDFPPLVAKIMHKDGHEIDAFMFGLPTIFEAEPAALAVVYNMTEQRKLEAQLMAKDRLASLGRLAASVGHEITNPLTYVMANVELARRKLEQGRADPQDVVQMLDEALEGADRMRRIVQDLRVFSPRQPEGLSAVDVRRVIDSCVRMTAGEMRAHGKLVQQLEDVPLLRANEARLAQVITNLLLNAAQSLPANAVDPRVTITTRRSGEHVEIAVMDTGVGIEAENLKHMFEPFFTTKSDRGGTGLGLSICHQLVTSQGGEIALTSEVGRGTCVTVRLPIASPEEAGAPSEREGVRRRRVLVVDDEIKIAKLIQATLDAHAVTIASSGHEALELLTAPDRFDVIVCDLMMPGLGGIDVHAAIAARFPGLERRMIFITGGAFTSTTERFLQQIPNDCLTKPFSARALVDAIERAAAN